MSSPDTDIQARQAHLRRRRARHGAGRRRHPDRPFGGVTGVSIRGASRGQDPGADRRRAGERRLAARRAGSTSASLDLGDVARIEVLTGPQGALWGSERHRRGGRLHHPRAERRQAQRRGRVARTPAALVASVGHAVTPQWALGASVAGFTTAGRLGRGRAATTTPPSACLACTTPSPTATRRSPPACAAGSTCAD